MPIGDPRDGFFFPTLSLMINSYNLHYNEEQEDVLPPSFSPTH